LHGQSSFELTSDVDRLLRSALRDLYSYELDSADKKFDELVRRFPNHPIGYMHKAEVIWWRALRSNKDKNLQAAFDRYTNEAVTKGEILRKRNPNDFFALLYTAGAYGNRTRYCVYITRSYYRAMRAGLKGYDYVKPARALRQDYIDCLIGVGAYNYFAGSLPAVIKIFAWMFTEGGDQHKGIEQLQIAAKKGEYGQTVAKMVLLGAYYNEKRFEDYRKLLVELIEEYSSNPVFTTWLADFYVRQNKLDDGIQSLTKMLNDSKPRGGLATAQIHYEKGRLELRKRALDDAVSSVSRVFEAEIEDAVLQAKAHLLRAFAWDLKNKRDSAVADYQTVLRLADIEDSHKQARVFLNRRYEGTRRN